MKKLKIFAISLISILLFFPFINVSRAAPSYVGLNIGDSFHWNGTVYVDNINSTAIDILGEANWTLIYNMLDPESLTGFDIGSLLNGEMEVTIINITDEMPMGLEFSGVGLYVDLSVSYLPSVWLPILNNTMYPYPTFYIVDPADFTAQNYFYVFSSPYGLFLPVGTNYGQIATWANANLTSLAPIYNNATISGLTDGFQITILGSNLDNMVSTLAIPFSLSSLSDIVFTIRWNANGVLSSALLTYGGLTLVSIALESTSEIPGFNIPLFLGGISTAVVGLIYIMKRKKRLL